MNSQTSTEALDILGDYLSKLQLKALYTSPHSSQSSDKKSCSPMGWHHWCVFLSTLPPCGLQQ